MAFILVLAGKIWKESEDKRYHIEALNNIEDRIDILGISPCNDEQLYLRLSQNTKLKDVIIIT